MKLVVEVHNASDLMPKDGQGSASPFVEVDFDGQRQRTQTKHKDLNPSWNEKLVFNVTDPNEVPNQTIDVLVYNERNAGHHKNFLGRVRINGVSVAQSEPLSSLTCFPLDKRGLFSHIRGDIALRIYTVPDYPFSNHDPAETPLVPPPAAPFSEDKPAENSKKKDKRAKARETAHTFHSIPSGATAAPPGFEFCKPAAAEKKAEFARVEHPVPAAVRHFHMMPPKQPEFGLVETSPPLPGRLRKLGQSRYKTASTYDLVEQMQYLYVAVVKAKDLPNMDISGSLDPYVEVKLGNYMGITKHFEKNQNPVWKQTFAFTKEHVQSNLVEVVVKDRDMVKDDFVGRVRFDISELPLRVPPDSPLAAQWYKLEDKKGEKVKGEIMLAVWIGTQADEAYPTACHSDTLNLSLEALAHTRSQVYYSPKLYYLRVHAFEAQDLIPSDRGRLPDITIRFQVGGQLRYTRSTPASRSVNPIFNEEFIFIVSEPSNEYLIVVVEDKIEPNKLEPLGRLLVPITAAATRLDIPSSMPSKWFNLEKPSSSTSVDEEDKKKKELKFSSKIHLRLCLDAGYHVLDESTHYSSDLQPSAKILRKPSIGILEVGILSACNLMPMKTSTGRTTDAYCIAKYGSKWVRTRTLLDTLAPHWNEQYTWEVYDPCTVITIAVFDNCQISSAGKKDDQRIGKVRIRLSTLEANRIYTHCYPLFLLQPSGLKKTGELHLALRFTCMAWVNMLALYSRPLLPKMHYIQPISVFQLDFLRRQATLIVSERLGRAEPPLRRETVEYMLDVDSHMWSVRQSKANFYRITSLLAGIVAIGRWFDDVRNWKHPVTTILVHVLFLILVCYPELILPTFFLYLFLIGLRNYWFRPRKPPHMDTVLSFADCALPDELDEEFDTFPSSKPMDIVRRRYDRLRSMAGRMQTVAGDLATQGERAHAILSWRDPRATAIFVLFSVALAVFLYVTPFQVVCVLVGLYLLRHPRFRSKMPSVPFNFYRRLPSKSDMLI